VTVDLFAGVAVRDLQKSVAWYDRLFGAPPAFFPNEVEAVWELADERHIYLKQQAEHAGHAQLLVFVDDLDDRTASIAARGIEPAVQERYDNGVRKLTYRDPDGNEISFGGSQK
jgi:catechol 2,3-dioxygenase-like lactoylglutathione lyase family enzyme